MADFPLPRAMLPKLSERPSAKLMMHKLLEHTISEFEELSITRTGVVDSNQWQALSRAQASQNGQHDAQVKVYSERECGAISRDLACTLHDEYSTFAALPPSAVLVSGQAPGNLDNVMYALNGTHTQEGLALFAGLMYDDIADCEVLHALESGDNFLGYKYVVKRSGASSAKLLRHRDMVYIEYTGYTQSSTGERLGFHIEHSVDVPGFPDLYDRSSSRVLQSVRYIFRQKSERIMEIYMLGNLQLAGVLNVGGVGAGGSNEVGGGSDLFSVSKLEQCAEIRRLTRMVCDRRETIQLLETSSHHDAECYLCHRKKRFFSGSGLSECDVCVRFVCSKCRNDKKLFVIDGFVGKFRRAITCNTCVLTASAGFASLPMHLSVAQQVTKSQGLGKTGICGRRHSGSSSSRDSSTDGHSESSGGGGEYHSYQGPVYTFSDVTEGKSRETRRPPRMDQLQEQNSKQTNVTDALSSRVLEHVKAHRGSRPSPGPAKREFPPVSSLPDAIPILKARDRTGTSSSRSSSDDSNSARSRHRGIYLTPPNPSKLYEEGKQVRRENTNRNRREHHHHTLEPQRRPKHTHQLAPQPVVQSDHQLAVYRTTGNNQRHHLARTALDHNDLPGHELAMPFSSSYSGSSSVITIAADKTSQKCPPPERGLHRTVSAPNGSSRSDLMVQMMELNMKAENTYNATQRNGVFLEHQIRTRQW